MIMLFKVDWTLLSEPVPLPTASKVSGVGQESIKQLYRTGSLGPGPCVSASVPSIPIYHLASLLVLQEAEKKQIDRDKVWKVLPVIAGAAYVHFQSTELKAGRCDVRGGTPNLNNQLWVMLNSAAGQTMLEGQLPGEAVQPQRYACFTRQGYFTCDAVEECAAQFEACETIDTWHIASQLSQGLRGRLFATRIA